MYFQSPSTGRRSEFTEIRGSNSLIDSVGIHCSAGKLVLSRGASHALGLVGPHAPGVGHQPRELLEVDLPIPVQVGLGDH